MSLDFLSSLLSFVSIFLKIVFLISLALFQTLEFARPGLANVDSLVRNCTLYIAYIWPTLKGKELHIKLYSHPWASPPSSLTLNIRSDTAYLAESALVWPHLIMCRAPHLKFHMAWQYQHQQLVNIRAALDFVLLVLSWDAWTEICRTFSL